MCYCFSAMSYRLSLQAPPKQKPCTIENSRVPDETVVCGDDEEVDHARSCDPYDTLTISQVLQDMENDEMSAYFRGVASPKVLVISINRPSKVCIYIISQ